MRKIVDSDSVIVTDDYSDGDTTNVRRGDVLRVEDSSREWIYGKFEGSEDRDGETFGIQKVPKYRVQPISEFKWTPKRFRRKLKHKLKRTGKRLSNKGKKGTAWVKEKIRASLNKLKRRSKTSSEVILPENLVAFEDTDTDGTWFGGGKRRKKTKKTKKKKRKTRKRRKSRRP